MRPKRNDIRISRKFVPNPVALKSSKKDRRLRSTRSSKLIEKNEDTTQTSSFTHNDEVSCTKDGRLLESRRSRNAGAAKLNSVRKLKVTSDLKQKRSGSNDSRILLTDEKRRRSGAENYINKRFLYDVVEPPKRNRQKKFPHFTDRSTAALMAVSSANLLKRHKSKVGVSVHKADDQDMSAHVRSRHGRRLKPKHEYSPSRSDDEDPVTDHSPVTDASRRSMKKNRVFTQSSKSRLAARSDQAVWSRSEISNKGYYSDENQDGELDRILTPKSYYPDASCLSTYSDVFNELQKPENLTHNKILDSVDEYRHTESSKLRNRFNVRHVFSPSSNPKESTNSFSRQNVFCSNHIPAEVDRLNADQLTRIRKTSEEATGQEDDIDSTESRGLINRQVQQSQDELEEDLLAPELSIITGSSTVANPDGVLVSTLTDAATMLSCNSVSGSSRRKSPVRPMQVLRTKTAHTSTAATNVSPNILVTGSDNNPFVFTSASVVTNPVYTRSSDIDLGHVGDVLTSGMCSVFPGSNTQSFGEPNQSTESGFSVNNCELEIHSINNQAHQILSSGSPLTLTSITSMARVPVCTDGISGSKGNVTVSSGLLPSLLTQSITRPVSVIQQPIISRVFMTPNTTRPVTTPATKPIISVPPSTLGPISARRRPTILKRTPGTGSSASSNSLITCRPAVFETSESDADLSASPSNRAIGVFNSGTSSQLQKPISLITTEESGSSSNLSNATTKLLQLVTTPSTPSERLNPNQTASDRLFGKRLVAYNRNTSQTPITSSTPTQNSVTTYQSSTLTNTTTNTTTPYRYAVVRGSADGKQYVLISNPRLVDQTVHEKPIVTVTTSVNDATLEPANVSTSLMGENYSSEQLFPLESCMSRAFKVEINGAHLIRTNSEGCSMPGSDRQIRTIYTTAQGVTTMAAT
ncbi:unnamed protein product [Heterobilharzia americana]|nr:unnamed protein product [Heterobilharzia americana]